MNIHEKYIKRCIEIAKNGLGTTAPNPMVGCVIVHDDKIIGEGYTSPFGGPHAEVNAIHAVKQTHLLPSSTLYVTLEPCSHYGKTSPCANLIIEHHIPKVVIGTVDTNSKVAGKGIDMLRDAGCEVTVGILEALVKEHHKRFFTFYNKKRPYIILKWAASADGFIAPETKSEQKPVWITNSISRQLVHKWRAEEQAILVGTSTVISDNPSLTTRDWAGKNPVRIVLDPNERLKAEASVFDTRAKTIRIQKKTIGTGNNDNLISINWELTHNIASQICAVLFEHNILSIIIEGGATTLQTFIDENLWDEARVFTGPVRFKSGTAAPLITGTLVSDQKLLTDTLKIYIND